MSKILDLPITFSEGTKVIRSADNKKLTVATQEETRNGLPVTSTIFLYEKTGVDSAGVELYSAFSTKLILPVDNGDTERGTFEASMHSEAKSIIFTELAKLLLDEPTVRLYDAVFEENRLDITLAPVV